MDDQLDPSKDGTSLESDAAPVATTPPEPHDDMGPFPGNPRNPKLLRGRTLLIIAGLIIALVVGSIIIALATKKPAVKTPTTVTVNTQNLSSGTLSKLTSRIGTGSAVQTQLTISPDTLFKGNVDIEKNLTVKGTTLLRALSVTGGTTLGGNLSVNGQITAGSLSVGAITISNLNLSGDVNFGGHLIPNGTAPTVRASVGASGGTAVISGNDTAGTVTISVGNGTLIAGEMAIINFHKPFALTPKVQLTPVNAAAANLRYYVSQSPTFFTVQSATTPANGALYTFNYFVTE